MDKAIKGILERRTLEANNNEKIVVIGAGPAGLATALALLSLEIDCTIFEKDFSVGSSWKKMPTNMSLNSPWDYSALTEDDLSLFPSQSYISREEFFQYLKRLEQSNRLDIRFGHEIASVQVDNSGGFILHTVDGTKHTCSILINCTGYFSKPFVPFTQADSSLPVIHVADYGNPTNLESIAGKHQKRALIIGKRITAEQTILELSDAGWQVTVSARSPIKWGKLKWMEKAKNYLWLRFEDCLLRATPNMKRNSYPQMSGGRSRKLIEAGDVPLFPEVAHVKNKLVTFTNGAEQEFDVILMATGYQPATDHLNEVLSLCQEINASNINLVNGVEAPSTHNLFFVGLDNQVNFTSRYLRGIRRDAKRVARTIIKRVQ